MDNSLNQGIANGQKPITPQPNVNLKPPLVTSTAPRPLGMAPNPSAGVNPPLGQPLVRPVSSSQPLQPPINPGIPTPLPVINTLQQPLPPVAPPLNSPPPPIPTQPVMQQPQPMMGSSLNSVPTPEKPSINQSQPINSSGGGRFKKFLAIVIGLLLVVGGGAGAFWFFTKDSQNPQISNNNQNNQSGINFNPGTQPITLTYWGLWETESVMRPVLDEFTAKYPNITIEYIQQSPLNYRERLQSEFARGSGPDIFRFHNTWTPMLYQEFDTLPDNIMSVSEFQQTFYPIIYKDLLIDKGIVGIPLMIDGLGLYYNKEMFATAGKSVPQSWEELRKTAIDLTITEGNQISRSGIPLGLVANVDHFSDILGLMIFQNNANPANMSDPQGFAKDAVNFYTIFNKTDKIWNNTLPPSTFAFANQKAAMMIAPSWRAHEVAELNPELDFAIAPIPQLPDSNVTWATYWVEGVSQGSKNQEAAWALLQFISTKESLQKLYTNASGERLFGNPFPRIDMAEQLIGHEYVGAYIEQAPQAVSWPMASDTYDNGINDRIIKYFEDLVNADTADDKALETVDNGVVQVMKLYQSSAN